MNRSVGASFTDVSSSPGVAPGAVRRVPAERGGGDEGVSTVMPGVSTARAVRRTLARRVTLYPCNWGLNCGAVAWPDVGAQAQEKHDVAGMGLATKVGPRSATRGSYPR